MPRPWSRPSGVSDLDGPDYWEYFGNSFVEHADIPPGAQVLDVGCGDGSSLFPAAEKIGADGFVTGIDICLCPD
ncbi:MAG: methyltransferase domain-containing protein [Planctomycetes bacterium]|nr:methyltransferase domain-containing protein [Planctomycetota bacterium]